VEIADVLETYASFRELALKPTGFMRVKMNISLRKRKLSPVQTCSFGFIKTRLKFMRFVVVSFSLQLGLVLGSII
jgi:hypothetical protein